MAAGDATTEGLVRLVFSDASETESQLMGEFNTTTLDLSTDPRQLVVLPMSQRSIGAYDLLLMQFKPLGGAGDVATDPTESANHTLVRVPVTIKNMSTGNTFETVLTSAHFNSSAENYTCPQNRWTTIGTYEVTPQERVKLGFGIADNSRVRVELKTAA